MTSAAEDYAIELYLAHQRYNVITRRTGLSPIQIVEAVKRRGVVRDGTKLPAVESCETRTAPRRGCKCEHCTAKTPEKRTLTTAERKRHAIKSLESKRKRAEAAKKAPTPAWRCEECLAPVPKGTPMCPNGHHPHWTTPTVLPKGR